MGLYAAVLTLLPVIRYNHIHMGQQLGLVFEAADVTYRHPRPVDRLQGHHRLINISRAGYNDIGIRHGSFGAIDGTNGQGRVALAQPLSQLVLAGAPAIDADSIKAWQGMQ